MKKALLIPNSPISRNNRPRIFFISEYLRNIGYDVYILNWKLGGKSNSFSGKIYTKLKENFPNVIKSIRCEKKDGIYFIEFPHILISHEIFSNINSLIISKIVRKYNIDVIISQNCANFPVNVNNKHYIYDAVDDHVSINSSPRWKYTRRFTENEIYKADKVTVISDSLRDVFISEMGVDPIVVQNGVKIDDFTQDHRDKIDRIIANYDLKGFYVISLIGNHGWWTDTEFALEVFERINETNTKCKLMIVGPCDEKITTKNKNVIQVGPVERDEIVAYFLASDLGILPFECCPFTDNCFPLKVLEYGAAKVKVVATPLKELRRLKFPHISLVEKEHEKWEKALLSELEPDHKNEWCHDWDMNLSQYDWNKILTKMIC